MQGFGIRWTPAEARVVGGNEPRQPCVRRGNRRVRERYSDFGPSLAAEKLAERYPRQPQLLDHAVLQRAKRAFDASLGLRAVGTDDVDVQRQQRATELGHPVAADSLLAVHPEDAVLVAVERHWLAMLLQISAHRPEVIKRRFRGDEPEVIKRRFRGDEPQL